MNKYFNNLAQANANEYNGTAKLITYPNGRIQIKFHQQTNLVRLPKDIKLDLDKYNPDNRTGFMKTSCYLRQTTGAQKRYFDREYNSEHYYTLSLTTSVDLTYSEFKKIFISFIKSLKNNYKDIEYFSAIEVQKKDKFHAHMILQFDNFPNQLKDKIKKLWKHGFSYVKKAYDVYGAIEYLTCYKKIQLRTYMGRKNFNQKNLCLLTDKKHMKFPAGAKLFNSSLNFGTKSEIKNEKYISHAEALALLKEYTKNDNYFTRIDGHRYGKEKRSCIDNVYIHLSGIIPEITDINDSILEETKNIYDLFNPVAI